MYNITLICSFHAEIGNCNPVELFKIIETIKPEIIFEEIPYDRFDKYYKYKSAYTLETDAINMYLENYIIQHIPVDTYEFSDAIQEKMNFLYNNISENNPEYIKLLKEQYIMTIQNGFLFLNSDRFNNIIEDIHNIEKNTLKLLNNNELFSIHNKWMEITNNRENEILNNIYKYSKRNEYNNAMLIIGAEHGKSILSKAKEYNIKKDLEINWMSWRIA